VTGGVLIGNQTLVLQRPEADRRGLYTCIASNAVGDGESNSISLDIKCKCDKKYVTELYSFLGNEIFTV
jgi:hypothetical protein